MNPYTVGAIVFACIFGAALVAMRLRVALPEHHLSADTKDTVKLAMGLVATMAALVLGYSDQLGGELIYAPCGVHAGV
jgi:hypothetical protein